MKHVAVDVMVRREEPIVLECPHCGSDVSPGDFQCKGASCNRRFRSLLGIPDLRIAQDAAVDYDDDWALAYSLAEAYPTASFQDLLERLWQARVRRELVTRERAEMRMAQIQRTRLKHTEELDPQGWLGRLVPTDARTRVLDLGCGPGGFLLPAGRVFGEAAGIDISMAWLVICRKRLENERISAVLACACAERLPFRQDTFDLVIAFDTLEHVADRERMVREAHRVVRPGRVVICTTPNRFSLSAEPHYRVWGVGLLPRTWMAGYVRWRTGQEFRFTYPLSVMDLRRLFARYFGADCRILVPELWADDIKNFPPLKRFAARLYNVITRFKVSRTALTFVAPFFRLVARKSTRAPVSKSERRVREIAS